MCRIREWLRRNIKSCIITIFCIFFIIAAIIASYFTIIYFSFNDPKTEVFEVTENNSDVSVTTMASTTMLTTTNDIIIGGEKEKTPIDFVKKEINNYLSWGKQNSTKNNYP